MSGAPHPESTRRSRLRFSRTEQALLAYAVFGGAAWMLVFFDGTRGGVANGLIAFLAAGMALAFVASRFENTAHERRRFGDGDDAPHPAPHASHEREKPPVNAGLVWTRRAAVAMCAVGLVHVASQPHALERLRHPRSAFEAFFGLFVIVIGVAFVLLIDRKQQADSTRWLEGRQAARQAEPPERALSPLHLEERRGAAHHARERETPSGLRRVLGVGVIVFGVIGLPLSLALFDAGGIVVYTGGILALLALINLVESRAVPGLRVSTSEADRRRAHDDIRRSKGWWAAHPPRVLRHMRVAFIALVVLGAITCVVMPLLNGESSADRYPPAAIFVSGLLIGLAVLGLAERDQLQREREWIDERQAEHERRAAH
ncbi:MAG: hypothetical protein H6831_04250 [Planctomycetes bacterium]|nr:hypothetical protein [Planctomycetota bacterium]